ncbi:MAG TPA: hypothetical protein PLP33_14770 [Leptospiraceae bacterium]|nr:hypothetical protein [Leptospiraceae bacterium]
MDKKVQLEQALIDLDDTNKKLLELASQTNLFTENTAAYARCFLKHKRNAEGLKNPSDELAKQMTYADPEYKPFMEDANALKYQLDIYFKLSDNLRTKISALKGSVAEEKNFNNAF